MDHIQTVAIVIEVCREYHLPLVLTSVDYEKAFDSVETNAILSALVDQGVHSSYIRAPGEFHEHGERHEGVTSQKNKSCMVSLRVS